jgi:hypothetical protein
MGGNGGGILKLRARNDVRQVHFLTIYELGVRHYVHGVSI